MECGIRTGMDGVESSFLARAGGGDHDGSDVDTNPPVSSSGGGGGNESSANCSEWRDSDWSTIQATTRRLVHETTLQGEQLGASYPLKAGLAALVVVERRVRVRIRLLVSGVNVSKWHRLRYALARSRLT